LIVDGCINDVLSTFKNGYIIKK